MDILQIIKLIRPKQYVKNLIIFLPLFFALELFDLDKLLNTILVLIAFSLLASSVYIFNDIFDRHEDALHPKKKFRPIASGKISIKDANIIIVTFLFLASLIGFWVDIKIVLVFFIYYIVNIFYSIKLKEVPYLEMFLVASGFVLRIFSGGLASDVNVTVWITSFVFLLSIIAIIGKRIIEMDNTKSKTRKVLKYYSIDILKYLVSSISFLVITLYFFYMLSESLTQKLGSEYLFLTIFPVLAGLVRYNYLLINNKLNENPVNVLIKDPLMIIILIFWILSFYSLIYIYS